MTPITLLLIALGLALAGWLAARARAWSFQTDPAAPRLAARPNYHGWYVALWIVAPVLAFIVLWSFIEPQLVMQAVLASPSANELPEFGFEREAILAEARAVAAGNSDAVFNPAAQAMVCLLYTSPSPRDA